MTQENPPSEEEPKNPLLRFLRMPPVADVPTSKGQIYLYALRVCDISDFGKLQPSDPVSQVRAFLPSIGSLTKVSDETPERDPVDAAIVSGLTNDEIEQIAEAYVQSSALKESREGLKDREPIARKDGETASAYLLRLMQARVDQSKQTARELHESIIGSSRGLFDQVRKSYTELGSTVKAFEAISRPTLESTLSRAHQDSILGSSRGLFDQLRKSYTELGSTVKEFETISRPTLEPSLSRAHLEINDQLAEHTAHMARERAEELEMVRLTGKMTAESAKTLKDLAEAATTLMEQMDNRDRRADQSTRKQITIAVWSVGITAVLALVSLIVSSLAYHQDRNRSTSGDQWQAKLLTAIEEGNQQRSAVERENQALREQVKSLDARIADMEAVQGAAAEASKATSAERRETNPGSTRPPP